jgi:hypothetical protein
MLRESKDLEQHKDLRRELLRRVIEASVNDPSPSVPAEEVFAELRKMMAAPRPKPAVWQKVPWENSERAVDDQPSFPESNKQN